MQAVVAVVVLGFSQQVVLEIRRALAEDLAGVEELSMAMNSGFRLGVVAVEQQQQLQALVALAAGVMGAAVVAVVRLMPAAAAAG